MLYDLHNEVKIDPKAFAFCTGVAFRGLTISPGSEGWRVIIRGTLKRGDDVYAMTDAEDIHEGFERLLDALSSKDSGPLWRHDRYSPKNRQMG